MILKHAALDSQLHGLVSQLVKFPCRPEMSTMMAITFSAAYAALTFPLVAIVVNRGTVRRGQPRTSTTRQQMTIQD
jgi:hypothetical protein